MRDESLHQTVSADTAGPSRAHDWASLFGSALLALVMLGLVALHNFRGNSLMSVLE